MSQATRTELLAIIDTYEGMLSLCPCRDADEHTEVLLSRLDMARAALASLEAE